MSFGVDSFGVGSFGAPVETSGGGSSTDLVIQGIDQAQSIENLGLSADGATDLAIQDVAQAQTIDATALSILPVVDYRIVPAGDSNASGRGSFNQTNSASDAYLFDNTDTIVPLTDPYDGGTNNYTALDDGGSAAGSYVHHLADLMDAAGKSVMFIPANKGGTTSGGWTSTSAGTEYAALKDRINAAGGDGDDLIILLHLGANDALASVSQATFKTNIETIVGHLNTDFPLSKKYLQKIHHFTSAPVGAVDTIRAGVEDVLAGSSGCLRGADLDGITTNIHYGATGVSGTCTSELNEVALRTYGAVFGADLAVADVSQAQTIDSPALSFETTLSVADVSQAQVIDTASLTTDSALAVDGVAQAQAIDNLVLNTDNTVDLTVQRLSTAQHLDAISLSEDVLLVIQSMNAAQTIDTIALSTFSELSITDVLQVQYADSLVLSIPSVGGGSYPTAEEIAEATKVAVLAALNATTIPVDVHKVLTNAVPGSWPTAEQNADALLSRTWP